VEQHLKELGFTEGEEKVYMALLKLGASSTGPVAKEAAVSRSKLYEILEKLSRKGIVGHYKKNNVSYFRAAPPERIVDYLNEKEEKIKRQKESFEKNLPLFEKLIGRKEIMKEAEVYEGMEGIKHVREAALRNMKSGDKIYFFGTDTASHTNVLGYWDDWNHRRVKKKIWSYAIYNQDAVWFGERRKKLAYKKVKYLPKKGKTHAWIEIYGDTLAIALKYKTPMSIVINNKFVAESFRTYFDILWSVSQSSL